MNDAQAVGLVFVFVTGIVLIVAAVLSDLRRA